MTTYKVPNIFIPGTKAKAKEVNENFSVVLDYISQTNQNSADVNLSNLTETGKTVIQNNSSQGRLIGEIVISSIPITDANVHLLDGTLLSGNGIYKEFIAYISGLYINSSESPSYFTTEEQWQSSVTKYGVCGKFVYDSSSNSVRLPKITGFLEGTSDVNSLGSLVEAGLPNITGSLVNSGADDNGPLSGGTNANGAFTVTKVGNGADGSTTGGYNVYFDASRSSSVYGKSSTVQPQAVKCYYYIVVANKAKTSLQVDIDNISSDLNGKVDTDLNNVTDTAKVMISGYSLPSNKFINLSLGTSGTSYTAPANGYFNVSKLSSSSGQFLSIFAKNNLFVIQTTSTASNNKLGTLVPVLKGETITITYNAGGNVEIFRFIYAKGSESEAQ